MTVNCSECPCLNDSEDGYDCNLGFTIENRWIIEGLQSKRLPCSFDCALKSVEYGEDKIFRPIETEQVLFSSKEAHDIVWGLKAAKTIEDMGGLWNGLP